MSASVLDTQWGNENEDDDLRGLAPEHHGDSLKPLGMVSIITLMAFGRAANTRP
jgi:hypothetical protein